MSAEDDLDDQPGLGVHSSVGAVRELYDRWSNVYDWNPILELVSPARRRAVELMAIEPGDTVVDMGTGTGANLPELREAVGPTGRVIGVDISQRMLAKARRLVEAEGWSNVTLIEGDVRDPPITGPVDGVLSAFVIAIYTDPDRLIEAWADLVEDGSVANLYAGRSTAPAAPIVNRLLSLYLRLFEEGWDVRGQARSPLDVLEERGELARTGLRERADRIQHDASVLGLAHLDVGYLDD